MNDLPTQASLLTPLEYYNLIRSRIEHEDNHIVQRHSWMVASQSFLFAAYATVLNGLTASPAPGAQGFTNQQMLLFRLIPIVGVMTCGLIYVSIIAAVKAMTKLRHSYHSRFGEEEVNLPEIQTATLVRRSGLSAPVVLPLVFIAVWLFLWIRGLG